MYMYTYYIYVHKYTHRVREGNMGIGGNMGDMDLTNFFLIIRC